MVVRAGEDDDAPAEPAAAPTPEPLSFPELSDDEEVKGAQMTAIITGASPARASNRRSLALSIRSTHSTPRITPPDPLRPPDPTDATSSPKPTRAQAS